MSLIWITKAVYVEGFKVELTFNDGIVGTVDLKDHLEGEVFKPLNEVAFFKNFELDSWTLTWPNDSDFAPEFLYELAMKQGVNANNSF
ncbi:MAG: DUF2442 domain-containing protein [Cytophagales bacterium]|nr:DUF2442 domain-containing protein [Cytophagales bacterium]